MDLKSVNYTIGASKISSKKSEKQDSVHSETKQTKRETKLASYAQVSSIVAGINIKNSYSSPIINAPSLSDDIKIQTKSEKEISELPFYNNLNPRYKEILVNINREDNKNSENLKLLLNLIKSNDADLYTLDRVCMESNISEDIANDIRLVQKAKDENIPVEDLFVPTFNSAEEAAQQSKAGDVYQLKDEQNVYYNNGKSISQLKMDKETYLKLFPPIEKFSTKQQNNGDCYLISTINSIFQNPETRNYILDCFEQDGNDVKVKLPNSDKTYTIKNGSLKEHGDLTEMQYIRGAEGIKIIECIYGDIKRDKYMDHAQSKLDNAADKSVEQLLNVETIKESKNSFELAIEQYQRDIEYLESIENKDDKIKKKINQLKSKVGNLKHRNKNSNNIIKSERAYENAAFRAIDTRNNFHNDAKNNADNLYLEKTLNQEYTKDADGYISEVKLKDNSYDKSNKVRFTNKETIQTSFGNNRNYYREGGNPAEVFTDFGIPVREFINQEKNPYLDFNKEFNYEQLKKEIISNIQDGKSMILVGATNIIDDPDLRFEKGIVGGHGYSIQVELNEENNQLSYKAINSYNTAYNTDLSEDEVKKYFNRIFMANP